MSFFFLPFLCRLLLAGADDRRFGDSPTGLLILGGSNARHSVEVWSPPPTSMQCNLPSLPRSTYGPSVEFLEGHLVTCYGTQCDQFNGSHWKSMANTIHRRRYHKSAVIGDHVLLTGGVDSHSTTELVPIGGGNSVQGFNLEPGRDYHCSIQVGERAVVLTGGHGADGHP